jgi:hypothetical protein
MDALDWKVGEWTLTLPDDPNPDWVSTTSVCEWLGNSFLKCEESTKDASGKQVESGLSVIKYDAEEGVYKLTSFSSVGMDFVLSGTVQDDTTSTWTGEIPGLARYRVTVSVESRDAYTVKTEHFGDGEWVSHGEGRWTRIR